ncbi:mannonate dehydratase [Wenxinia marina]|uniref:Mannonate dehydratase n=1 Tax=Wenxinia marina DSM 24838 TaxID=1123501 RepID=A0A0D0PD41_9RHOB|nr:mannonate dehydratase [Wenxinia marina]KIQ69381.1 D-mannonate dehydratase [Wenxinia marina DSM 24838]GGL57884.1 mannonate dehydratase [Wenxinia marina]
MIESWRWFGPLDRITLPEIVQTGATGIVTALHEVPYGEVWVREAVAERRREIEAAGLTWEVVESLPVSEAIKLGQGDLATLFANYRQSLANLAAEGVRTVCYNFMPLLDWTRTRLDAPAPGGGRALRFDAVEMAAFDIHLLGRAGAEADWPDVAAAASAWTDAATEADRSRLLGAIMSGLPGAYARYDVAGLREVLRPWAGVTADDLRAALARFLAEVVPAAEDLGMRLCIHPDDPPRPLLGLPRVVSTGDDLAAVLAMQDSPANGVTLCSGSLGAHPSNDVPTIARAVAPRIHFAHLRNVAREPDGSFQEAPHLGGDTDMPAVISVLLDEEARRREAGRDDHSIPFRPDHGHELLTDIGRGTHPGYPLIGRLRGLAELRGVIAGLRYAGGR